jgi:hypothetical protein
MIFEMQRWMQIGLERFKRSMLPDFPRRLACFGIARKDGFQLAVFDLQPYFDIDTLIGRATVAALEFFGDEIMP